MKRAGSADRLIRVAAWGQVSIVEGVGVAGSGTHAVVIEQIGIVGDRQADVLGLAERWRNIEHPALAGMLAADEVSLPAGPALQLQRRPPGGSTLLELLEAHGPVDGVMVAALFIELLDAVRRCHKDGLALGALGPADLYVCPPGSGGAAALTAFDAGTPTLIVAANGALGRPDGALFEHVFGQIAVVAPEVSEGALPGVQTDIYTLCATIGRALLGRDVHEGADRWAVIERARAGVSPEVAAELAATAPGIGALVVQGMAVAPILRRGVLGDLQTALAETLGPRRLQAIQSGQGGDPWGMGSPLIALAAYVRVRPFADRFSAQSAVTNSGRRASATETATPSASAAKHSPEQHARLHAALQQLDMERARRERRAPTKRSTIALRVVVTITVLAIGWAIAFIGVKRTRKFISPPARQVQPRPPPAVPKPPQPRALYKVDNDPHGEYVPDETN